MNEFSESIYPVTQERGFSHVHVTMCQYFFQVSSCSYLCVQVFQSRTGKSFSNICISCKVSCTLGYLFIFISVLFIIGSKWNISVLSLKPLLTKSWARNNYSLQFSVMGLLLQSELYAIRLATQNTTLLANIEILQCEGE